MSTSRRLDLEPADALRTWVPLVVLLGAIVVPGAVALPAIAAILLAVLTAGVAISVARRAPVAWSWASTVPAAAIVVLRVYGPGVMRWDAGSCSLTASQPVLWALGEGAVVVAATMVLAVVLNARSGDTGLRWPAGYALRWAALGAVVILAGGLAAVMLLGGPLLGVERVSVGGFAFLLPATLFAVAVAVSEEVAWRGAFQGWLARVVGPFLASLAQACLYGVWWGIALGSSLGGIVAGAAGLLLGAIVIRTRSVAVVIAWHAAFNVAFYVLMACRTG
jgi:membrane protease YdiL (CAAX protease family)